MKASLFGLAFASLAAVAMLHVFDGTLLINAPFYFNDYWFTADVAWRAHLGQVPHIDVKSPIGQGYFWPYVMTTAIWGPGTAAVLAASALVGLIGAIATWAMLQRDAPTIIVILTMAFVFGAAVTPRWMDGPSAFMHSHMAYYNRWGWALTAPLAMYAFVPLRSARVHVLGAVLYGIVVGYLLLLKVTYGLAGIGFLDMSVVASHRTWKEGALAAFTCAGFVVCVGLFFGNLGGYLNDLAGAASAGDSVLVRLWERRAIAEFGVYHGMAVAAILLALGWNLWTAHTSEKTVLSLWRPVVFCATVLAFALGLAVQNHPQKEAPFFVVAVILAYAWFLHLQPTEATPLKKLVSQGASLALLILAFTITTVADFASIAHHRFTTLLSDKVVTVPALADTQFKGVMLPSQLVAAASQEPPTDIAQCEAQQRNNIGHLQRLLAVVELFDTVDIGTVSATNLAFFNPLPVTLNAPSPRDTFLWIDTKRSVDPDNPISVDAFIGDAKILLRNVGCGAEINGSIWPMFEAEILEDFAQVSASSTWEMYRRVQ